MRPATLRPVAELAADKPHGVRLKYLGGCKCELCLKAASRWSVRNRQLAITGRGNPLVPAEPIRRHILKLSQAGVGYKAVCDAASANRSIVFGIRQGRRQFVRKKTAERILAVTKDALADAAVIPAAATQRLINLLLAEGYTKSELARRLGYRTNNLQLRKDFILARNASRVERLYRTIMRGA